MSNAFRIIRYRRETRSRKNILLFPKEFRVHNGNYVSIGDNFYKKKNHTHAQCFVFSKIKISVLTKRS